MPPVREASTKPSAATVLPAPVACSNQKRLAALGSSTASPACGSSSSGSGSDQSSGSSSGSSSTSSSGRSSSPGIAAEASISGSSERGAVGAPVAVAVGAALGLGQQRGQRARERVDLVGGEHRAVDERRLVLGEQAVEAEQQRPAAAPLARRRRCGPRRAPSGPSRARPGAACPGPGRRPRPRPRAGRARARTLRRARGRRKKEGVRPPGSLYQAQP